MIILEHKHLLTNPAHIPKYFVTLSFKPHLKYLIITIKVNALS